MKKTKIVVPALAVLLLSTAASVSGTVAWFSMNTSIVVSGMTVTTKVSSSLQIAELNDDALFSNDDLSQTRSGILEPASTANGQNFFYTTDAKANGDANGDEYISYSEATTALHQTQKTATGKEYFDDAFNDAYGYTDYDGTDGTKQVSFAYIDYSFYLRANIVGSGQKIVMDKCNLLYGATPGTLNTEWAWRVALFSQEVNSNTNVADSTAAVSGNLKTVLDLQKSKNQNEVTARKLAADEATTGWYNDPQLTTAATPATADGNTVYYQGSGETAPKAISAIDAAPTAVSNPNAAANVSAAAVTGSKIYKVIVRLWLEGEDVSCTSSTFANLTDPWSLKISFKLGSDDGVTNISSDPAMVF